MELYNLTALSHAEMNEINGGNNTLAWWEALGDAINAMKRARDEYSSDQAVSLYQSVLLGGREAGVWDW